MWGEMERPAPAGRPSDSASLAGDASEDNRIGCKRQRRLVLEALIFGAAGGGDG